MAIRPFNSIGGYTVGTNFINVIDDVGNVTANNLTVTNLANLGAVSNITITGGTNGQALTTDGNGNLSFSSIASNKAAPMPYYIGNTESFIVDENFQGLFSQPIEIDGELVVDGVLIELGTSQNAESTQVYFDNNGVLWGNSGFTFNIASGNLAVPGNLNLTGDIIPSASNTYSLGSNSNRWSNLYLSGNTIILGNATITENEDGAIVLTNAEGGTLTVEGADAVDTSMIANGTSNIQVVANAGVAFNLAGTGNVVTISADGDISGANITSSGNVAASGVKTDNFYYANGTPVNFGGDPGGSNNYIQYNDNETFGGSANLTYDDASQQLTLVGTANITNVNVSGTVVATGNVKANAFIASSGTVQFGLPPGAGTITVSNVTQTAGIFTSGITDVNIGLAANVVICGTGKTLTARGNVNADNLQATTLSVNDFYSSRTGVTVGSANTTIDTFNATTYRSVKYTIKVSDSTGYQAVEALLVHDGINSIITVYGSLSTTGSDLVTLTTVLTGGNVVLRATPNNSNTSVNLMATYVPD
jgi:hypothetical protein